MKKSMFLASSISRKSETVICDLLDSIFDDVGTEYVFDPTDESKRARKKRKKREYFSNPLKKTTTKNPLDQPRPKKVCFLRPPEKSIFRFVFVD